MRTSLLPLLVALLSGACSAPPPKAPPQPRGVLQVHYPLERFTLDNGLRVVLHPDHSAPRVAVHMRVEAGAADDPPGREGLAHLIEHLMFRGSRHVDDQQHTALLARADGSGINAATSLDETVFHESVASTHLPLALWLEADRLASMPERLTQATLDTERGVVESERAEGLERDPGRLRDTKRRLAIFPPGHPYHRTVIGDPQSLRAITLSDVRSFFAAHYTPTNTTLSLAGDFDPAEARALVVRYFASIPRGPSSPRQPIPQAPRPPRPPTIDADGDGYALTFGFRTPPSFDEGWYTMRVAAAPLSRRLNKLLSGPRSAIEHVFVDDASFRLASTLLITLRLSGPADEKALERQLFEALASLSSDPIGPWSVAESASTLHDEQFSSTTTLGLRAAAFAEYERLSDDATFLGQHARRHLLVTPAHISRFVAEHLRPDLAVVIRTTPGRPSPPDTPGSPSPAPSPSATSAPASLPPRLPWAPGPDLALPPAPLDRPRFAIPIPQLTSVGNGVRVLLLPIKGTPVVSIRLQVARGAADAPPGVADLAARLAAGHTTTVRTFEDMFGDLADLAPQVSRYATPDTIDVAAQTISLRAIRTLALLTENLLHPDPTQAELDSERRLFLARMGSLPPTTRAANAAIASVLHPPPQPEGVRLEAHPEALRSVRLDQIRAFFSDNVTPSTLTVVVTGGFDREHILTALDTLFRDLPARSAPARAPRPRLSPPPGTISLLDIPGSPRSTLAIAAPLLPVDGDEAAAELVVEELIGNRHSGAFKRALRDHQGLTYNAEASIALYRSQHDLVARASFSIDDTAQAARTTLSEVRRIASGGFTDTELESARSRARASLEAYFETPWNAALLLAIYNRLSADPDAVSRLHQRLDAVTPSAVRRSAADRLDPSRLSLIIAGDAARIRAPLEAAGVPVSTASLPR